MSKAFTRESDENEDFTLPPRTALPPGVRNYITSAGAQRLRDKLATLLDGGPSLEKTQQSQAREARIRQLREIIDTLVISEPPAERDTVRFGATVTVQRQSEAETYRLVGIDETNLDRNEISWLSPLGKVLLGKRAGDRVRFSSPAGFEELTILTVAY